MGSSPPIKLKISLGKKKTTSRTIELSPPRQIPNKRKSAVETSVLKPENNVEVVDTDNVPSPSSNKKRKRQNSADEEEKWLEAVDSGNLPAVDAELKAIRDP